MAIVRIGGRQPTPEEVNGPAGLGLANTRCPFIDPWRRWPLQAPLRAACGTPPPPGRPWLPRDEFLCDGGDRGRVGPLRRRRRPRRDRPPRRGRPVQRRRSPRVLPTNVVCVYAPRFASVRVAVGASEALNALARHLGRAAPAHGASRESPRDEEAGPATRSPARTGSDSRRPACRVASTPASTPRSASSAGSTPSLNVASHQLIQGADRKTAIRRSRLSGPGSSSTASSRPRARWRPGSSRGPVRP